MLVDVKADVGSGLLLTVTEAIPAPPKEPFGLAVKRLQDSYTYQFDSAQEMFSPE